MTAQPEEHRVSLGVLQVTQAGAVLVDRWPSDRWWQHPPSAIAATVGHAISQAQVLCMRFEPLQVTVDRDPDRVRTVTVTGRLERCQE